MQRWLLVVALLAAGTSPAAGFSITTHSARATGMGTAVTAHLDDASSIAYNPAGLVGLEGFQVLAGDTLLSPGLRFTPQGADTSQDARTWVAPPPHLYIAYPFLERFAAGVGLYVPFGAQVRWPEDFQGRFLSTQSRLAVFDINPTVAYAPVEWLRVGAGLQILHGSVDLRRRLLINLPNGTAESGVKLTGSDWGLSYDVGVQVEAVRNRLSFGATYRGRTALGFEGEAEFSDIPEAARPLFQTQRVSADVTLPSTLSLGVAVKPRERLTVAFDATWYEWSRIKELAVEFENPAFTAANPPLPKNWHVRWNFHLGAEYGLTEDLWLRAGLGYDPTPVPDETLTPELPDATRLSGAVGAGFHLGRIQLGAAYELVLLQEKRSTSQFLPGTYGGTAHVVSLTAGYTVCKPQKR